MSNFVKVKDKLINLDFVDFIWEDDYYLDKIKYYELGFDFNNDLSTVVLFESEIDRKNAINSFNCIDLVKVDTYYININQVSHIVKLDGKIIVWFASEDSIYIETNELPKI